MHTLQHPFGPAIVVAVRGRDDRAHGAWLSSTVSSHALTTTLLQLDSGLFTDARAAIDAVFEREGIPVRLISHHKLKRHDLRQPHLL